MNSSKISIILCATIFAVFVVATISIAAKQEPTPTVNSSWELVRTQMGMKRILRTRVPEQGWLVYQREALVFIPDPEGLWLQSNESH